MLAGIGYFDGKKKLVLCSDFIFVVEGKDVQDFKDPQMEQFYNAAAQLRSQLHAYSEATSSRF